jgi:hypothetical protein
MAEEKDTAGVALGKLEASKGGKARAEKRSAERKSAIACKADKACWARKRQLEISEGA